jgi:hypothetical protein
MSADFIRQAMIWLAPVEFMNYRFSVRDSHGGVFLQATYMDADIYTGKQEPQVTRKWLLSPQMTESELIQTAFKCCLTSMEHRAREAFKFRGARIFGPHFDIYDLVQLCRDGREDAGSRVPMQSEDQSRRIDP